MSKQRFGKMDEKLNRFSSDVLIAEQQERDRISRMLHDDLQQLMVAAKIGQEALISRIEDAMKPEAERVLELINQSIDSARSLTAQLSPPVLRSGDIFASLEWLVQWMHENLDFEVILNIEGEALPSREDLTILLFHSIRELLLNVCKHAGVKSASVFMACMHRELRIVVSDQGAGFEPESIEKEAGSRIRLGLFSIEERLANIGGRMEIVSAPGRGSTISMFLPVDTFSTHHLPAEANGASRVPERGRKRVVIVHHDQVMLGTLFSMLKRYPDIDVIGEATSMEKALNTACERNPDVIVMDFDAKQENAALTSRLILSKLPNVRIVGLTRFEPDDTSDGIEEIAFFPKSKGIDALIDAIRGA
ncbi:MAG: histidine kinase [Desulfobacterales bacterium]